MDMIDKFKNKKNIRIYKKKKKKLNSEFSIFYINYLFYKFINFNLIFNSFITIKKIFSIKFIKIFFFFYN
jgi:hypothetical protein